MQSIVALRLLTNLSAFLGALSLSADAARAAAPAPSPAASADAPVPTVTPAPAAQAGEPTAPDAPFGEDDRMRGRWSMGAALGLGVLPAPGFGPTAGMGFQWRRFGISAEGRVLFTPLFAVDLDHSASATLPLGILSLSVQVVSLPSPFSMLEFSPFIGAGRLILLANMTEDRPNYFETEAHPFVMFTGVRFPLSWQPLRRQSPAFYVRTYIEGDVGLVRTHISFNNVTVWNPAPPLGLTFGIEVSIVTNQPRNWSKPDPANLGVASARSARRYW